MACYHLTRQCLSRIHKDEKGLGYPRSKKQEYMDSESVRVLMLFAKQLVSVMGWRSILPESANFLLWLVSERILNRVYEPLLTPKTRVMSPCIVQNSFVKLCGFYSFLWYNKHIPTKRSETK